MSIDEQKAVLRDLYAKTTDGDGKGCWRVERAVGRDEGRWDVFDSYGRIATVWRWGNESMNNAVFIAEARNAMPAIMDELDRLRQVERRYTEVRKMLERSGLEWGLV